VSRIGTAGWTIPAPYKDQFPENGSHLQRYATRLNGVEINSSFYRPHRRTTYERWAASVPEAFRFSVKVPRTLTHDHRLNAPDGLLERFLEEVSGLGGKLGILLVQLPPSLAYKEEAAAKFFQALARGKIAIACEPRHISWFSPPVEQTLAQLHVARVAADPPRAHTDGTPGGDTRLAYFRLHGSPQIYYSAYPDDALAALAPKLRNDDWCILDNTAAFHAMGNALRLTELISAHERDDNTLHLRR
jgi:uncharacterized protein YecE (DUF72 family)